MRTTDYGYDSCTPPLLSVAIPVRPLRTRLRYIYVYPFVMLVQISNNRFEEGCWFRAPTHARQSVQQSPPFVSHFSVPPHPISVECCGDGEQTFNATGRGAGARLGCMCRWTGQCWSDHCRRDYLPQRRRNHRPPRRRRPQTTTGEHTLLRRTRSNRFARFVLLVLR